MLLVTIWWRGSTEGACAMAVPAMSTRPMTSALRIPSTHPAIIRSNTLGSCHCMALSSVTDRQYSGQFQMKQSEHLIPQLGNRNRMSRHFKVWKDTSKQAWKCGSTTTTLYGGNALEHGSCHGFVCCCEDRFPMFLPCRRCGCLEYPYCPACFCCRDLHVSVVCESGVESQPYHFWADVHGECDVVHL